eukprot:811013-Rhodomonas_salina.4
MSNPFSEFSFRGGGQPPARRSPRKLAARPALREGPGRRREGCSERQESFMSRARKREVGDEAKEDGREAEEAGGRMRVKREAAEMSDSSPSSKFQKMPTIKTEDAEDRGDEGEQDPIVEGERKKTKGGSATDATQPSPVLTPSKSRSKTAAAAGRKGEERKRKPPTSRAKHLLEPPTVAGFNGWIPDYGPSAQPNGDGVQPVISGRPGYPLSLVLCMSGTEIARIIVVVVMMMMMMMMGGGGQGMAREMEGCV